MKKEDHCRTCGGRNKTWHYNSESGSYESMRCKKCTPEDSEEITITRGQLRLIMDEFTPTIAEDSGEAEWTVGELNDAFDHLKERREKFE